MAIKIIGLLIGILVLCAGLYYLIKEERDLESKRIYATISVVGGVLCAVCAVLLVV